MMEHAEGVAEVLRSVRERHLVDGRLVKLAIAELRDVLLRDRERIRARVDAVEPPHSWADPGRPASGAAPGVEPLRALR